MFPPSRAAKKLMRSRHDNKIAGVCGGVARYLDVDATLVRLVWLMMTLLAGWGLLGYLLAWIIMPMEPPPEAAPATAPASAPAPGSSFASQTAPNR
jgi:phage shock protein PspC (stress-responsive transcriptional regulator)